MLFVVVYVLSWKMFCTKKLYLHRLEWMMTEFSFLGELFLWEWLTFFCMFDYCPYIHIHFVLITTVRSCLAVSQSEFMCFEWVFSNREPILPGIIVRPRRYRKAAGTRGLTRAGRTLRRWRRRRCCDSLRRSLGSSCRWGWSSWSWWRARSPAACPLTWMSRRRGRTAWWTSRSQSLRWRDASCCSSLAACGILHGAMWHKSEQFIMVQWVEKYRL